MGILKMMDDGWMEEEKKRGKKMKKINKKKAEKKNGVYSSTKFAIRRHSSNSIFCSVILSIALSFDSYFIFFFVHIF